MTTTVLYVINNLYSKKFGGRLFTKQVDETHSDFSMFVDRYRITQVSDYVIKFRQGNKPVYLKNRSWNQEPYTEKQLAWMLLKAKTYGTIKTN